jgi:RepB DNA-primase from phage plasmid
MTIDRNRRAATLRAVYTSPISEVDAAAEFLRHLGATKYPTFQTFGEGQREGDKRLARILDGTLAEHADELCELNRRGAGVFVSVNLTDGKGRKRSNITQVRAVTLDLDGASLDPVRECASRPHLIVESSPGRFHAYWIVKDFPLEKYEDVQRAIARRFDGDPAVALLTACARLPGFFHNKAERFQTRVIEINDLPSYSMICLLILRRKSLRSFRLKQNRTARPAVDTVSSCQPTHPYHGQKPFSKAATRHAGFPCYDIIAAVFMNTWGRITAN